MIERVVLIKLKPEFRAPAELSLVAQRTRQVLGAVPQVRAIRVGTAADRRTAQAYGLCIELRFDDMDAVEAYRAHRAHRAYVDVFLAPMLESIRVYNYEDLPADPG